MFSVPGNDDLGLKEGDTSPDQKNSAALLEIPDQDRVLFEDPTRLP